MWIKFLEKEEIKLESDLYLFVNFFKYATPEILVKVGAQNGGQNEGPVGQSCRHSYIYLLPSKYYK